MRFDTEWKDYEILATGNGEKLERWGDIILLRPDPQVIWKPTAPLETVASVHAVYRRSKTGGGGWEIRKKMPEEWLVRWRKLCFRIKPMGFKHTGLFPEQAVNWARMIELIEGSAKPVRVLNLFAYTGGATVACLSAGAEVCHVDAAKAMVERARENALLSKVNIEKARFLVDDCVKFVAREIRRGKKYDAVIMDPPSYGRGPDGETWKIEEALPNLLELVSGVLSETPLFFLINSYTTGLQPAVLGNLLRRTMQGYRGETESYEVCLPTKEREVVLPCGASGLWVRT